MMLINNSYNIFFYLGLNTCYQNKIFKTKHYFNFFEKLLPGEFFVLIKNLNLSSEFLEKNKDFLLFFIKNNKIYYKSNVFYLSLLENNGNLTKQILNFLNYFLWQYYFYLFFIIFFLKKCRKCQI